MLIDTHCHLNFPDHFPDVATTIQRAKESGVSKMLVVGCDEATSQNAIDLAERHDELYAIVGWHPNYSANYNSNCIARLEKMMLHERVLGIGEIGFDNHWQFATKEQQKRATVEQMELAVEKQKPVVFHCREAYDELLDWLELLECRPPVMVLHCFSGDSDHARRASQLGCYFGFDGPLTYKKNDHLRAIASCTPAEKILLETDSPFLTPHPHRGKPNEPAFLPLIASQLAAALGDSLDQISAITSENACRAFGIRG